MKIIGEKLTQNELLLIKGGVEECWSCYCYDGSANWVGNYSHAATANATTNTYCYSGGNCNYGEYDACELLQE